MQFGLIQGGWLDYLPALTRLALLIIDLFIIALVYFIPMVIASYKRAKKLGKWISLDLLPELIKNRLNPASIKLPTPKMKELKPIEQIIEQELTEFSSLSIITISDTVNKCLDLFLAPLKVLSRQLLAIGLGSILLGLIGSIYHNFSLFRGIALMEPDKIRSLEGFISAELARSRLILLFGLLVSIIYLILYAFISTYPLIIKNRVSNTLLASEEKTN
ncbi:MAG: hypothetical protein GYA53_03735 [Acidobacteria bacterium]|nr:hypothetical protein [Acidobacteriota bacterium]